MSEFLSTKNAKTELREKKSAYSAASSIMTRGTQDAAELVDTMLRLDEYSPASSLQLSPYAKGTSTPTFYASFEWYNSEAPSSTKAGFQESTAALAGSGEEHLEDTVGASQLGGPPRHVRGWAAEDSASASEGRKWPMDSLEHALELELDIQEADLRLVRSRLSAKAHACCHAPF